MKKIIYFVMLFGMLFSIDAAAQSGKKIYINPGHGQFTGNDRNVQTINYALGNTNGFYESKSNCIKGNYLYEFLVGNGASASRSRTTTGTGLDHNLSTIAGWANSWGATVFISIHSNAANASANYLQILFNGTTASPKYAASKTVAGALWDKQFPNVLTSWTAYSATNKCIVGDQTFLGYNLGVLNPLTRPGVLSEGSFHDYRPETHRLLSNAYCRAEAWNMFRGFNQYFGTSIPNGSGNGKGGAIVGWVKNSAVAFSHAQYGRRSADTESGYTPINGAVVELLNSSGGVVATYTTDNNYNGVFGFFGISAGTYTLRMSKSGYNCKTASVTVSAGGTTYYKMNTFTTGSTTCGPATLTVSLSSASATNTPVGNSHKAGTITYLWITAGGSNVSRQDCDLTSSNTDIAEISVYGTITTKASGTTVIKAVRRSDKATGQLTLTVTGNNDPLRLVIGSDPNAPYGTILASSPATATVPFGKNVYLGIDGNNNASNPAWLSRAASTLTSSNPGVATVATDGIITPVSNGTTTIAVVNGTRNGSINLTVTGAPEKVTGVTVSPTPLSLNVDDTSTLTATVSPSSALNKNVTWSSNNPSVATVNNGLVTAVAAGTATITVTTVDGGFTANCAVTVTEASRDVTSVSVDPSTLLLSVNGISGLTAIIKPSNALNQDVNWSSSNTGVATVDNTGLVTAVAEGSATITAASAENPAITGSCTVTVKSSIADPDDPPLKSDGRLVLIIVARNSDSSQLATDPPLKNLDANTLASTTGSGCLFINDTSTGTSVTRSREPVAPALPTTYEIYPPDMAEISNFGGITTFSDCVLWIKATNDGRSGVISIPVGIISVGLFNTGANVIKVSPTETGVIAEFGGSATIELYTVNGVLIDKAKAFQSYSRYLANGVYIIRINGQAVKFVK